MIKSNTNATKREALNIRIEPDEKGLIDSAAYTKGKNHLDQVIITAKPQAYTEFLARLDMPPQPNKRLQRTMQNPAPWDKNGDHSTLIASMMLTVTLADLKASIK